MGRPRPGLRLDSIRLSIRDQEGKMRSIVLATAFAAITVTSAYADDMMASRYGNTTLVTDAKGVQTLLYYHPGGTLTGKQGDMNFTGTWKVGANNQLCLNFSQPVPGMTNPTCVTVTAHKVGDSWDGGDGRKVKLVQGVQ
jgi:hypothetical protein